LPVKQKRPLDHAALANVPGAGCLELADCVEKLICASERERLIQDQVLTRNNDSRIGSPRFLYCRFPLHSAQSATFSTQSAPSGPPTMSAVAPLSAAKRTSLRRYQSHSGCRFTTPRAVLPCRHEEADLPRARAVAGRTAIDPARGRGLRLDRCHRR